MYHDFDGPITAITSRIKCRSSFGDVKVMGNQPLDIDFAGGNQGQGSRITIEMEILKKKFLNNYKTTYSLQ